MKVPTFELRWVPDVRDEIPMIVMRVPDGLGGYIEYCGVNPDGTIEGAVRSLASAIGRRGSAAYDAELRRLLREES